MINVCPACASIEIIVSGDRLICMQCCGDFNTTTLEEGAIKLQDDGASVERATKIGIAAMCGYMGNRTDYYTDCSDLWKLAAIKAVEEAYRIDGVADLLKTVGKLKFAWGEAWASDGLDAILGVFSAADRVSSAIGSRL